MKKIITIFLVISFIFNISFIENIFAKNYLLTDKNYYSDTSIDKSILDTKVKDYISASELGHLKNSAQAGKIIFEEEMTLNDFYKANNFSPEDNYWAYMNVKDKNGNVVDSADRAGTTNVSLKIQELHLTGEPWRIFSPIFFSRLTVGSLARVAVSSSLTNTTQNYKFGDYTRGSYFPNFIGYGEKATVNDFMMTEKNDFSIPNRYNTQRNDVWLTMRSSPRYGSRSAQAFLRAVDSEGNEIKSKNQDDKFFINLSASILVTPVGYDSMGFFGKFMYGSQARNLSQTVKDIGVNDFSNLMNFGLKQIQESSGAKNIPAGMGGQINLTGFYRKSDIDNNFLSTEDQRSKDSLETVDVTYFMYTTGDTSRNTNSEFKDVKDEYKKYITMGGNILKMYSPNETTFKLDITRPFFKNFGKIEDEIIFDENNFDSKLGFNSFEIEDNGVLKNTGEKISVDENRVRVRISEDDGQNYLTEKYTIEELKQKLEEISQDENNIGKIFKIAYTYAAVDSKEENIGLLPLEIEDNTGAYAVPFVRNIYIPSKVIVKHIDENGNEFTNSEEKILGKIGEDYTTDKKDFEGYDFEEIKDKELGNGTFKKGNRTIIYKYKKQTGKIIVKHIDEAGNEIESETKEGEIGKEYEFSEKTFTDYEFVKIKEGDSKTGNFEKTGKIITFIYKKIEKQTEGKIFIKFLDENNNEIFPAKTEIGKIGEDFNFSPENISDYEFVKIFDGDLVTGKFTEKDQTIRFIYKKKESSPTNPTPTISETGKIIIKYVDEAGNEIKTETKEGKIGENYEISETQISGYEFVKILDGDSKTGNFEEKEKIITFIYKKIENKIENSGSSPVVPVIQKDPRVTDINENIPKIEEPKIDEKTTETPKVEEPKIEVKNTLPKDFEAVSPMGDEEDVEVEKVIKKIEKTVKKLPTTGPITQEEIYKKGGKKKENSKVETKLPDARTFDLAQSGEKDLNVWLDKLPPKDRNKDKYVVLPEQGLILPINTVSRDSKEYKRFTSGKEENFEAYLNKGTVELPITRRGYGEIGNKIIAGHSSYWKKSKATYKTHFQKIIGLEKEEEVWIFEKNSKTKKFEKYIYKVTASYNTDDEDISILKQGKISELTLFTCTPIGGFDGRWVVKAKFLKKE